MDSPIPLELLRPLLLKLELLLAGFLLEVRLHLLKLRACEIPDMFPSAKNSAFAVDVNNVWRFGGGGSSFACTHLCLLLLLLVALLFVEHCLLLLGAMSGGVLAQAFLSPLL